MLSIIIVTYQSQNVIQKCLESLKKITDKEIVIVDNNSKDNTIKEIRKLKQSIKLIKNNKNVGLTKAWNQGAKKAKGDILFFLNPDTVLKTKNAQLVKKVLHTKNSGVVGFRFENSDGTLQHSAGHFPTLVNVVCDRLVFIKNKYGMQIRNPVFYKKKRNVDWVSGSGFLVSKKVFVEVGGFDKTIFMYTEDIDFCKRITVAGYHNYFDPRLSFQHTDAGKNTPLRKPLKYFYMRKGILHYFDKNNKKFQKKLYKALLYGEAAFLLLLKNKSIHSQLWKENIKKVISLHT